VPNGPNTSWMYQGRQAHGWFGDGTSPDSADDESEESDHRAGGLFDPGSIGDRVDYAARCVIGSLSRADRRNPAIVFDSRALGKLRNAVIATDGASGLSRDAFRQRFFDPYTSDEAVDRWRSVAKDLVAARTSAELGAAGAKLADVMQQVGLYRWPRYLSGLNDRAVIHLADSEKGQGRDDLSTITGLSRPSSSEGMAIGATGQKYAQNDQPEAPLGPNATRLLESLRVQAGGDPQEVQFAQRGISSRFAGGVFAGRTIDEVAAGLRDGTIHPDQLPLTVVKRDGVIYTINNRSLMALRLAGVKPTVCWTKPWILCFRRVLRYV
jgi:hypothetical protein